MTLVIAGQDIRQLHLGYADESGLLGKKSFRDTEPKAYLADLSTAMGEWGIGIDRIDRLAVVTGPGSFTSARTAVTIANAIAFARELPIMALENPDELDLSELWERHKEDGSLKAGAFAEPSYDRPPRITMPS